MCYVSSEIGQHAHDGRVDVSDDNTTGDDAERYEDPFAMPIDRVGEFFDRLNADIEAGRAAAVDERSDESSATGADDGEPKITSWEDLIVDDEWLYEDADTDTNSSGPSAVDEAELSRLRESFGLRDVAAEARTALEQNDAQNSMNPYVLYPRSLEIIDHFFEVGTAQWQRAQQPEFAPIRVELEAAFAVQAEALGNFREITLDYQQRFQAKMAELQPEMARRSQEAAKARYATTKRVNDEIIAMNAGRLAKDRARADARHREWMGNNLGVW